MSGSGGLLGNARHLAARGNLMFLKSTGQQLNNGTVGTVFVNFPTLLNILVIRVAHQLHINLVTPAARATAVSPKFGSTRRSYRRWRGWAGVAGKAAATTTIPARGRCQMGRMTATLLRSQARACTDPRRTRHPLPLALRGRCDPYKQRLVSTSRSGQNDPIRFILALRWHVQRMSHNTQLLRENQMIKKKGPRGLANLG